MGIEVGIDIGIDLGNGVRIDVWRHWGLGAWILNPLLASHPNVYEK